MAGAPGPTPPLRRTEPPIAPTRWRPPGGPILLALARQDVGQERTRACRLSPKPASGRTEPGRCRARFAYNPSVLARAAAALDRAAFKPASLPNDLITGIALAPPVIAGLIIFKAPALEMLAVALAIGAAGQIAAYWLWRKHLPRTHSSPLIATAS